MVGWRTVPVSVYVAERGGFGMTPWCDDLVCSWRRLLADRHSLPFPWTLSLHRRWFPSASHHPLTFLFLLALTFPLPSPFPSLGLSLRRPPCPSASPHSFPSLSLGRLCQQPRRGEQEYHCVLLGRRAFVVANCQLPPAPHFGQTLCEKVESLVGSKNGRNRFIPRPRNWEAIGSSRECGSRERCCGVSAGLRRAARNPRMASRPKASGPAYLSGPSSSPRSRAHGLDCVVLEHQERRPAKTCCRSPANRCQLTINRRPVLLNKCVCARAHVCDVKHIHDT